MGSLSPWRRNCASGRFPGEGTGGELCSGQGPWEAARPQESFQGCEVGAGTHILKILTLLVCVTRGSPFISVYHCTVVVASHRAICAGRC